jgi:hypothetical protein
MRQENQEFETSVGYMVRPYLKMTKPNRKTNKNPTPPPKSRRLNRNSCHEDKYTGCMGKHQEGIVGRINS